VTIDGGIPRCRAKAAPLPRDSISHALSNMGAIVFPEGESLSSPSGNFFFPHWVLESTDMTPVTVEETRRARLAMLVARHGGMTELCAKLTNQSAPGLTRILNANVRHEREGRPYVMGSPMARKIETDLNLPEGWMDTPPTYAEIHGEDDPRARVMILMESLPKDQWPTAARLLDALAKPEKNNGTTG
jgi:hypothetical protein